MTGESFIGWRYLYRRSRSRAVIGLTVGWGALTAALLGAFLVGGWTPGSTTAGVLAGASAVALLLFPSALFLNFFSAFTTISMTGVFWGVALLSTVLSVTSGFEEEFQDKVFGVNAHVLVMKYGLDFGEYRDSATKVENVPGVRKPVAPFVFNEMLIAREQAPSSAVLVKGVVPAEARQVLAVSRQMVDGSYDALERAAKADPDGLAPMLIGRALAKRLRAKGGDRVRLVSPLAGLDPSLVADRAKAPRMREFRVAGIFYSGFDEYDRRLVYVHLREAQDLVGEGDVVTGVEMLVDDVGESKRIARDVDRLLGGPPYRVIDWRELNHNLFTALRLQKVVVGILVGIIILVAMFGVIATLTMLVIDKTREVAILKAMGMADRGVWGTFQVAGMTIGALGTATGLGLGLAICAILSRYTYQLDPRVYLIDRLPVSVRPVEMALVALMSLAVCFLATLIPSVRATWLRPVEGLRYE